jgi:short-subunit dehydrogenase
MNKVQHKGTAVITGASSGIGATYAARLARRGYDLILVARSRERLERVAARIEDDTQAFVGILVADLNDPADLRRVANVFALDTSITLLVNSAGMGLYPPTLDCDIAAMQRMITLNVAALTQLAHAAALAFVDRGRGDIINISSVTALAPEILNGAYSGTKAFVLALSQALHAELAGTGVRVQVVLPGATATEFWRDAGRPVSELPPQIVMTVDDLVDAALAGFDLGELVTLPSLPCIEDWERFEAARRAMRPKLSLDRPAARYGQARATLP